MELFTLFRVVQPTHLKPAMQRIRGTAGTAARYAKQLIVLYFMLASVSLNAQDSTAAKASVTFPALPDDSITIFINGLEKQPDASGTIPVEPGPVLVEISRSHAMAYSSIFLLDTAENREIPFVCTDGCALLHINTDPPGATISMDGHILGTSPYLNGFIPPGSTSFMVTHPGRIPVIRRVELTTDSVQYFLFQMEYTQALKDSLDNARRALKVRRQRINASLFGAAALGFIAAGAWYDYKAYNYLIEADRASGRYDNAQTRQECDNARKSYKQYRQKANRPIDYRNALYTAAGLSVVGLYLSFVF